MLASRWWLRCVGALGVVLGWAAVGFAQISPSSPSIMNAAGHQPRHGPLAFLPFESINPLNGGLQLTQTDLVLPGNAGLDLSVTRHYSSKIFPDWEAGGGGALMDPSWVGLGWRLHFGRVVRANNGNPGVTAIQMADGSEHPLWPQTAPDSPGWITTGYWRYDRPSRTLRLPNGLVYTFNFQGLSTHRVGEVWYATDIRDPYGNRLEITWARCTPAPPAGPTDTIQQIRQHLGGGQVRTVSFATDAACMLRTMTYEGRTWTYTHAPAPETSIQQQWVLTRVQRPGPGFTTWQFAYGQPEYGPVLRQLTTPLGGRVTYQYARVPWWVRGHYRDGFMVVQRSAATQHAHSADGTWTFQYAQGDNRDTSIVRTPCGEVQYRFWAIGDDPNADYSGWLAGLLRERRVLTGPGGAELEREEYGWTPGERVSHESIPGIEPGVWVSASIQPALLTHSWVTRQSERWETRHDYRASPSGVARYNDFGHPWQTTLRQVAPAGSPSQVVTRTFRYGFTPYLVGRVETETVTRAGKSLTTRRTFDLATGFVTSETLGDPMTGLRTSYERTAQGNVGAVIDGRGNRTTLLYERGVARETRTPLVTTTRVLNPDGTVASETVAPGTSEATTTSYGYDGAGRLTQITPPVGHVILPYTEDVSGRSVETRRHAVWERTFLDGFGQPVRTEDVTGVKTQTFYDACGRVTRTSAPFTTETPRFTEYTYDALGRTLTGRAPDDSLTRRAYTGLQVTVTDAEDRVTRYTYRAERGPSGARLEEVRDASGVTTRYQYHVSGALEHVAGPGNVERTWHYDDSGRLTEDRQPESGRTQYQYDAAGNLTRITNAAGQVIRFTYDANNRVTRRDDPLTTFAYDAAGRVREQRTADVTTTFTYDAGGRPETRQDELAGLTALSRYAYNGYDRVRRLTYPSGRIVRYEYDTASRLALVLVNAEPFATDFTYGDNGRLASYQTGAVTHEVTYDNRDRVQQLRATTPSGTAHRLSYRYDGVNQVSQIIDVRFGQREDAFFGYDSVGRLTQAEGPWGLLQWRHDAEGNRIEEIAPGGTTNYGYDSTTRRLMGTMGPLGETFQYDAAGRLTREDRNQTAYNFGYTAVGELASVSAPNLTATYHYDAEGWRIDRRVAQQGAEMRRVTIRAIGQQTLSEYEAPCDSDVLVWQRDIVYVGGRLLGAIRANTDLPAVAFTAATSSVNEGAGSATVTVRLTTATGLPLACPATVQYATAPGTAQPGTDYVHTSGTLTFAAGTASNATQTISVPIVNNTLHQPNRRFTVSLSGPSGAQLGTPSTHTVTIIDNDPPPTVSINNVTVRKDAGGATLTLSLNRVSGRQARVTWTTVAGTAQPWLNYEPQNKTATIAAGAQSTTISVPIRDYEHAEPTKQFTVQLSAPVNATIAQGTGVVTITEYRPRAPIDPTKPGHYFADVPVASNATTYLIVANPQATSITARLTFTRRWGLGTVRNFTIPGNRRVGIHVQGEAALQGDDAVSAAVQTLTAGTAILAEQVVYWGNDLEGGRATEGVTPAPVWYFAEGATHHFVEDLTIFNPSDAPIRAVVEIYGTNGWLRTSTYPIESGPGRRTVRLSTIAPGIEHATIVRGETVSGEPVPIVAERVMTWNGGRDGHSAPGQSQTRTRWEFAEGATHFDTFVALFNAGTSSTTARIAYKHEGTGSTYTTDVAVPAKARRTVLTPAWLPAGNFAVRVESLNGQPLAAERVMYTGPNWAVGTAGSGQVPATQVRFAEGAPTVVFDTFLAVADTSGGAHTVTVQIVRENGWTTSRSLALPANGRRTLNMATVAGLETAGYQLRLSSTRSFVAERATYWPRHSAPAAMAADGEADGLSAERVPDPPVGWPPGPRPSGLGRAGLYVDVVEGEPANDEARAAAALVAAEGAPTPSEGSSLSSGWSGGHVAGGAR